jgi:hypothetical protein
MHTPPLSETCHDCKLLMREPTAANAKQMAERGFYNCKRLSASSFRSELAVCVFKPSRFERVE